MNVYVVTAERGDGYGHQLSFEFVGVFLSEEEADSFVEKANRTRGDYGPYFTVNAAPLRSVCHRCDSAGVQNDT